VSILEAFISAVGEDAEITVDGYPDPSWPQFSALPPEVQQAHGRLTKTRSNNGARFTGIDVDPSDPQSRRDLLTYGPHSVNVSMRTVNGRGAVLDDCGEGAWLKLTPQEFEALRERFPEVCALFREG
jgi:hypothetical protein